MVLYNRAAIVSLLHDLAAAIPAGIPKDGPADDFARELTLKGEATREAILLSLKTRLLPVDYMQVRRFFVEHAAAEVGLPDKQVEAANDPQAPNPNPNQQQADQEAEDQDQQAPQPEAAPAHGVPVTAAVPAVGTLLSDYERLPSGLQAVQQLSAIFDSRPWMFKFFEEYRCHLLRCHLIVVDERFRLRVDVWDPRVKIFIQSKWKSPILLPGDERPLLNRHGKNVYRAENTHNQLFAFCKGVECSHRVWTLQKTGQRQTQLRLIVLVMEDGWMERTHTFEENEGGEWPAELRPFRGLPLRMKFRTTKIKSCYFYADQYTDPTLWPAVPAPTIEEGRPKRQRTTTTN